MKISDIAYIKLGYLMRKESRAKAEAVGLNNVRIITPNDLDSRNVFSIDGTPDAYLDYPEKHSLSDGEVLLLTRGRFAAGVFRQSSSVGCVASSHFSRIILNSDTFLPEFVAMYINSQEGKRQLNKFSSTVISAVFNKTEIGNIELPNIAIKEQEGLVALQLEYQKWQELRNKQGELWEKFINNTIKKRIG